jgi:poly-gamma-glutamate capsule biosynthesis protein CapA/YwtB (metallophosphatase superfamily)
MANSIGAHPYLIQGLDYYKGKPIAYSLGDFLFPDYVSGIAVVIYQILNKTVKRLALFCIKNNFFLVLSIKLN